MIATSPATTCQRSRALAYLAACVRMLRKPIQDGVPRRLEVNVNVQLRAQAWIVVHAPRRNFNERCTRECIGNPRPTATAKARVIRRRRLPDRSCIHANEILALQEREVFSSHKDTRRER